ncbi:MAG TPA: hypothetical protein PKJ63_01240 [Cyclobacteriaceae bacterium]|nr:hypothetical protein [Cyclobacteriaceae bacterium]HRX00263.1 hypothetical protein [Cyclobacteriaceae bacterium]
MIQQGEEVLLQVSNREGLVAREKNNIKSELQLSIMQIGHLLRLLCKHHGGQHPEIVMAESRFSILAEEILLMDHKEKCADVSHRRPEVLIMKEEAQFIKSLLRDIRKLTNNYTLPSGACKIYEEGYARMKVLDAKVVSRLSSL